jgi:hypothetical protein
VSFGKEENDREGKRGRWWRPTPFIPPRRPKNGGGGGSGVELRRVEVGEGGCWYDAPSSWGVGRGSDTGPGTAARVRAAPQHKAGEWVVADWWARYSTGRQGQMGLNPIRISNEFKLFQKPSKFWMIQKVPF